MGILNFGKRGKLVKLKLVELLPVLTKADISFHVYFQKGGINIRFFTKIGPTADRGDKVLMCCNQFLESLRLVVISFCLFL